MILLYASWFWDLESQRPNRLCIYINIYTYLSLYFLNTYFTHTFANKTTNSKPRHIEKTSDSYRWPTSNPVGLRPLLLSWSWQSWQVLGWQNLGEETVVTTLLYWLLSRFTVTKMICANSEPSIWAFTQAYRLIYTNITCGKIWLQVTLRWPQCPWQSSISLAMRLLGLWVFLVGIKASRSCVIFIETLRYLLLSHGTCWTWYNHYGFWIISKKKSTLQTKNPSSFPISSPLQLPPQKPTATPTAPSQVPIDAAGGAL